MNLKLKRIYLGDAYTIGRMYINGKYVCDTLEDTVRDTNKDGKFDNGEKKIYGKTAIPYGVYSVAITYSPHFKRDLPLLLNVPDFEGVRIHPGNTDKDTLGCILVGQNKVKGMVINSRECFNKLFPLLLEAHKKGEKISIDIA